MTSATRLAKLSPPRLADAIPRERLFARLDALCTRPLLWIEAPAGAGKTTLLGSYVEVRGLNALWYEVDGGDRDIASFFHHLATAAATLPGRGRRLPRFTAEHTADPRAFARRFFRQLYAQWSEPTMLVFDRFEQTLATDSLCAAMVEAAAQAPAHVNITVLSRSKWPSSFARMAANGALQALDSGELLLRQDEASAIAQRRTICAALASRLLGEAEGWAAGFRLLLEGSARRGSMAAPEGTSSRQEVFDYFVDQLFAVMDARKRDALLDLALLPYVTAPLARTVSSNLDAIAVVECLARQQLFAQRSGPTDSNTVDPDGIAFRFHALFQAFLRQQLRRERGEDGMRAIALRSARALRRAGDREAALDLYLQAGAWREANASLRQLAPRLLQHGRGGRLLEWIAALPESMREDDEWLLYIRGGALLAADPAGARIPLEHAYALAAERQNEDCMVRAIAGIIDATFLLYTEFRSVDRWIDALSAAAALPGVSANPELELRTKTALLSAVLYRHGNAPHLEPLAERMLVLLDQQHDASLRASAVAWLLSYASNTGSVEFGGRVAPLCGPLIASAQIPPLRRGLCAYFLAWHRLALGDVESAEKTAQALDRLSAECESPRLRRYAASILWWIESLRQRTEQARHWADQYEAAGDIVCPYDVAALNTMHAWAQQSQGCIALGRQYASIAMQAYDQAGTPWYRMMIRGVLLWSAVELDDRAQIDALLAQLDDLARTSRLDAYRLYAHQARAWLALRAGRREESIGQLRALFESARRHGVGMPMRFIIAWMPRLCAEALRNGIAGPYVRSIIKTYGWRAPFDDVRQWPYPVRIFTLGGFSIQIEDETIGFGAKAPRKALGLLKALICLGGNEVRDHQLIDALWKDEEADAARASFNVTLHRLRRLLGKHAAIEVVDGCLTLNSGIVWVDAFAYERALSNGNAECEASVENALALYRGPLLPTDSGESWSAAARERLRTKFLYHVGRRARHLELSQRGDDAIALYLRGLDADSLSESMYQGLMRCHRARGQHAEALSLYWRLRQTLSLSLGIAPSSETEVLFHEIGSTARVAPF